PNAVVLAPEFLKRARTLALAAARRTPGSAAVQTTLAECELRAGYASAARRAAERAVACQATAASLLARALATYADYREDSALAQLQAPRLTEFAPMLGMGRLLSAPIDQTFSADPLTDDAERRAWVIPYGVQVGAERVERTMTLRVGPSAVRTISKGRVVGGLCFPLDADNRAHVFGVVEDPDLQFATPRCHDLPSLLGRGRNTVLFGGTDRRLLLHSPGIERERGGRAFLLANNCSSSYFHWMMDAIGRLSAFPAALTDPDIRFIVPTPLRAFQTETLSWLGITPERMLQVPADEIAGFDELVVVHHRKDGNAGHPDVVRWVREHLTIPQLQAPAPPDRRLYLRRGGLRRDRIVNAPEVEDMCRVFGYEVVDIDAMTVAAQRPPVATRLPLVATQRARVGLEPPRPVRAGRGTAVPRTLSAVGLHRRPAGVTRGARGHRARMSRPAARAPRRCPTAR
ncbi:MAG: glycosyltransferase 61 family protein, partial [Gemmatimonadaceae bacterium]